MSNYRDLVKHSGIYGVGQVILRVTSIILLPIYTRHLTKAEYGVMGILDLGSSLLGILLSAGLVRAVTRHHFEVEREDERDELWWTGYGFLVLVQGAVLVALWFGRDFLARLAFGAEQPDGSLFVALALGTVFGVGLENYGMAHLRVQKQSTLMVLLSLLRVAFNVGFNLCALIVFNWGLGGFLLGNFLAGLFGAAIFFISYLRLRGRPRFRLSWFDELFRYGGPLIVTAFLAAGMHQADRFLIRLFESLDSVGIYNVAYQIGQKINTLLLVPFSMIWYVSIHEVGREEKSKTFYVEVFHAFFLFLTTLMLGVSFFIRPILTAMVAEEFRSAADLVPIICLAYLFFSLHTHFHVPALIAKRTAATIPPHILAVMVNVGANLVLIPRYGLVGSAWASVLTFATFSFSGLVLYRRLDKYDYPLGLCAVQLALGIGIYWVWLQLAPAWTVNPWSHLASAAGAWALCAVALLGPHARKLWRLRERLRSQQPGGAMG